MARTRARHATEDTASGYGDASGPARAGRSGLERPSPDRPSPDKALPEKPLTEHQALSALGKLRTLPERLDGTADPLRVGSRAAEVLGAIVARCYAARSERAPETSLPRSRKRRFVATRRILDGLAEMSSLATDDERPVVEMMVRQTLMMQAEASLPRGFVEVSAGIASAPPLAGGGK